MPPELDTGQLQAWFADNLALLLFAGGLLVLIYAYSNRIVGAVVGRFVSAQAKLVAEGSADAVELQKRTATLESLVRTLLRAAVVGVIFLLILGRRGLWGGVAGVGVLLAGVPAAAR